MIKFKSIKAKIKNTGFFGKSQFGRTWQGRQNSWFEEIHDSCPLLHRNFKEYFKAKNDVKTVLELGCGSGIYPIRYKNLFQGIDYTGIDISQSAIDFCQQNSNFTFICEDFLKSEHSKTYDLIFAHGVIDCAYDIELFLSKILKSCKKYAYISSCRGYHPDSKEHKMEWRDDEGVYYNDLSVEKVEKFLLENGLNKDEFSIRPQESGTDGPTKIHAVIEIYRKN